MSPLIDVIFLLLIFYAVTTQFVSDERLKLKLPEAETAESVGLRQEEKPPEVKVATDGSIWIDDQIVVRDGAFLDRVFPERIGDPVVLLPAKQLRAHYSRIDIRLAGRVNLQAGHAGRKDTLKLHPGRRSAGKLRFVPDSGS